EVPVFTGGLVVGLGSASGDYEVKKGRLRMSDGVDLSVVEIVQKDTSPWIMVLHGHGPGLRLLFDEQDYAHAVAMKLADGGFSVLAVETRSFGESLVDGLEHSVYVNKLMLEGEVFHGQVV